MALNRVLLMADHSKEGLEAIDILFSLPKEIQVKVLPTEPNWPPIAYWRNFSYQGIGAITRLRDKLQGIYDEGQIPA